MIKAVSFDCAQTLLEVRWNPVQVAREAAERAGVDFSRFKPDPRFSNLLDPSDHYGMSFSSRQDEWKAACHRHQPEYTSEEFWHRLTYDWLKQYGQETKTHHVAAAAEEILFGPNSQVFLPMEGASEAVIRIKSLGLKVIVLSNWDDSLVRALKHCGLADLFDEIYASLVEGSEKPEAEFFELAHRALGLEKEQVLHVGDNPIDDAVGAMSFGWKALLLKSSLAAGPWELNAESRQLISSLRPEFSLDPWLPCPVVENLSQVADYVEELNS